LSSDNTITGFLRDAGFDLAGEPGNGETRRVGSEKAAAVKLLQHIRGDEKKASLLLNERHQSAHLSEETLDKLILLLNGDIDNTLIRVANNQGALVATTTSNKDGVYSISLPDNTGDGYYVFSTEADSYHTQRKVVVKGSDVKLNLPIEDRPVSMLTRAVIGYQQAGASATEFEQNYFFDLYVSQTLPFRQKINPDFGERWRTWGAIRAISAPQSGNVTIGGLTTNFVTNVSNLNAGDAARVFDYLGGVEYRLPWFGNNALLPSFDRDTKQKFTLSLIFSGGFVTPTNPSQTVKTFKISEQFRARFKENALLSQEYRGNELDAKDYVAFVQSDRDRFFRQYYAGIRMQTFFFNRHNIPLQRFPAQLDLQFGINEYVTRGRATGGVIRLDGYFPLPYENMSFINLFGTAIFRPVRSQIQAPLILEPAADAMKFDPKAVLLPIAHFNRDYYRVGIGIDFVSFVGKLLKRN